MNAVLEQIVSNTTNNMMFGEILTAGLYTATDSRGTTMPHLKYSSVVEI